MLGLSLSDFIMLAMVFSIWCGIVLILYFIFGVKNSRKEMLLFYKEIRTFHQDLETMMAEAIKKEIQ